MTTKVRIATGLALSLALPGAAAAGDSIFDVEHARAEYRAGRLTPYNAELMDRYGWPTGCYPRPCFAQPLPPRPVDLDLRRPDWRVGR